MTDLIAEFASGYDFQLDDFQRQACHMVADSRGVLVAAPTGSGKTVVGEFACWLALAKGQKCFYTTPIKALSNQKYHDLVARHSDKSVGLLTGDQSINPDAQIVVMTTEVLRNMLYAKSDVLAGLGFVVMDEVHYLADRFRGAVWEEVILGLAPEVSLIALSATVSNAEEFGEWLNTVRSDVGVVVSEKRPVPLFQHMIADDKLYDLFEAGRVNQKLTQLAHRESRTQRDDARRPRGRSGKGKRNPTYGSGRFGGASARRFRDRPDRSLRPSRGQVVRALAHSDLLPAIVFIFSRAGCDGAVRQLLGANITLTNKAERRELLAIADRHGVQLSAEDKAALEWDTFRLALARGIAAHHAGLLPTFKAIVEEGFTKGLIKVVFATETLALGINMPARSVVIEKLVKYNGESHVDVTPGEFTQLTGRAGRRGIDVEGHAVVVWQPGIDPRAVAGLASRRTYPLHSSFAPNYNMAANLISALGKERARALLEQSFAQFQSDRRVVKAARNQQVLAAKAAKYWDEARCERGDFKAYARLRDQISQLENEAARLRRKDRRAEIIESLSGLNTGEVIWIPAGAYRGWAAVVEPGHAAKPNPLIISASHQVARVKIEDFTTPTVVRSKVRVPKHFDRHSAANRRALARALDARLAVIDTTEPKVSNPQRDAELSDEITRLRAELRAHPCHDCPESESHARSAEEAIRLERSLPTSKNQSRNSIAAQFDRTCLVLESLGYLSDDKATDSGRMLQRIYSEMDLVAAECVRQGVFDSLSAPSLAAVLSSLVYEARAADTGRLSRMPDRDSESAQTQVRRIWRDIGKVERDARVERTRAPHIGFAGAAYWWADGESMADVLARTELTAGDFVRWVRQVIDLAAGLANAPGTESIRGTCREVVAAMRRGIIDFEDE